MFTCFHRQPRERANLDSVFPLAQREHLNVTIDYYPSEFFIDLLVSEGAECMKNRVVFPTTEFCQTREGRQTVEESGLWTRKSSLNATATRNILFIKASDH